MYFDIHKSETTGQYWWVARGGNHEKLCHSEQLTTKAACINAIRVLKGGAATAFVYDETGDRVGDASERRISVT